MKRPLALFVTSLFALFTYSRAVADGVLPLGKDGKPLNLDFESGTLKDWLAEGAAFEKQPIRGDTVAVRRTDTHSAHAGEFWIGGYENVGDKGTGRLTSASFEAAHP